MSIAVFASGSGSNFERLVEVSRDQKWPVPIRLLVCDKPGAKVLERAERLGIPAVCVSPKTFADKAAYETFVLAELDKHGIEWIVLAGYMRLIGSTLLDAYPWRIVNIHPSLLPAFPGKDAIGQAFAYGVKVSGVSVHLVDEEMDTGPLLAQVPVLLEEDDDLESFTTKIHQAEHRLYPEVVYRWITGAIKTPDMKG
ncbi:phosphoribosylglycinamide formyltransferase [Laceyella sacchari]|jgi:phosphoribosylglycinamide formyltransferase 1|uniref:Phosphoribosylglycinamide formyltransferase n=1 Tax=Laceyella sacchari TaxID=37482 RepID=A0ABY5U2T4_LACSH|nr:phosphoribosylglycinamide formyltransferase [Laceyella sacchari]TCW36149.1 phosphoribosylglycinamide formyltransferase-1 [Laceyella sacchari]UWE03966.1 phosphoribosylglycinamide formyltransferase [Laceyella sacchari]